MAGTSDARVGRSVEQRGAGDGKRRVSGQATATRPLLAVCTVPASASDPLTPNPGYVGRSPRPPGFASPVFGSRLKTNRVARGHHGLPVSSKTPLLPPSRWPSQVHRGSPMSSAAAPAVRGPGGHGLAEQGRSGVARTGLFPSSTRANSGAAGARCLAPGRRGRELGSRRV